jgi:aspartyl-tRNA(Asn)/glutamyl-tRNA(Gln) amidotransferase subunit B
VERALLFEIARQQGLRGAGEPVVHETLLWDAHRGEARPMRSKEESHDYRYFPDPDLPVLEIDSEWLAEIRADVPEMPWVRAARFGESYALSREHAEYLTASRDLADYYEAVVEAGAAPQEAASWVMGEVLAAANLERSALSTFRLRPPALAGLLELVRAGRISRPIARQVFNTMLASGEAALAIVEREGLAQVRDTTALTGWVAEVMRNNPDELVRLRGGEGKLMGFFVGQVMKLSRGTADPREVAELIRKQVS